jgi:hypothetical protein
MVSETRKERYKNMMRKATYHYYGTLLQTAPKKAVAPKPIKTEVNAYGNKEKVTKKY